MCKHSDSFNWRTTEQLLGVKTWSTGKIFASWHSFFNHLIDIFYAHFWTANWLHICAHLQTCPKVCQQYEWLLECPLFLPLTQATLVIGVKMFSFPAVVSIIFRGTGKNLFWWYNYLAWAFSYVVKYIAGRGNLNYLCTIKPASNVA